MENNQTMSLLPAKELEHFGVNQTQYKLLTDQIAKGASPSELRQFLYTAKRTGLDPFKRQIYLIARNDKRTNTTIRTPQTSIDGFRAIAARTNKYGGSDDAIFDNEDKPTKATVTVYRIEQGIRCPFTASARWIQYCPKPPSDFMWQKMPNVMLGKCAEALALRKAFPEDLSGLYTEEEMDQAGTKEMLEIKPIEVKEPEEVTPAKVEQTKPVIKVELKDNEVDNERKWNEIVELVSQIDQEVGNKDRQAIELYVRAITRLICSPDNYDSIIEDLRNKLLYEIPFN